jgi:hypothetical protein
MTFDIEIRYETRYRMFCYSISKALNPGPENIDIEDRNIRYRSTTISKNIRYRSKKYRYRPSTISKKHRYRSSKLRYHDIPISKKTLISRNANSISVEDFCFDVDFRVLRYRCFFVGSSLGPGLPTRYRTQIAVCTLHCKSIITRGS